MYANKEILYFEKLQKMIDIAFADCDNLICIDLDAFWRNFLILEIINNKGQHTGEGDVHSATTIEELLLLSDGQIVVWNCGVFSRFCCYTECYVDGALLLPVGVDGSAAGLVQHINHK